ncbi:MAG: hypothetical protein E4H03_10220, partial [Myxococcales bacterium]
MSSGSSSSPWSTWSADDTPSNRADGQPVHRGARADCVAVLRRARHLAAVRGPRHTRLRRDRRPRLHAIRSRRLVARGVAARKRRARPGAAAGPARSRNRACTRSRRTPDARRGRPPGQVARHRAPVPGRHQRGSGRRSGDGGAGLRLRSARLRQHLVSGEPAGRDGSAVACRGSHGTADRVRHDRTRGSDHRTRPHLAVRRPGLCGPATDVAQPSDDLGRTHRSAGLDRAAARLDGRHQSRPGQPHRLVVVHRLADRVRPDGRLRHRADRKSGDSANLASGRACRHRSDGRERRRGHEAVRALGRTRLADVASIALTMLLASIIGCDGMPGKPSEADRPLRPDEITNFATLYATQCAGCHGADGRKGAARALNDASYLAVADDAVLESAIRNGIADSLMPGFGSAASNALTDEQV